MIKLPAAAFLWLLFLACKNAPQQKATVPKAAIVATPSSIHNTNFDSSYKTIHVFVALCDNKFQGIVPVPAKIGNGQDADNNLYWGCSYGIRSYFSHSNSWQLIKKTAGSGNILERLIFKHRRSKYYLVADAFNGQYIKQCTTNFLQSSAGQVKDTLTVEGRTIGINGNASLLSYIGHDGLMDFTLTENYPAADRQKRDVIILACISKKYFAPALSFTNANPLLWSTGLMAPEAYTLHDAVEAYISNAAPESIRLAAAKAYSKYQHCSLKAATNLLVYGR